MKAYRLAVGLLCALPLAGLAEPAKDRAASKGEPRIPTDAPRGEIKSALRQRLRDFNPTERQIEEAQAFYSQHAPNFFKAYTDERELLFKRNPKARLLQKWITHNHLELRAIESADPKLYEMKLEQLGIEDKIMGKVADARSKKTLGQPETQSDIRTLTEGLLDSRKKEAAHRIIRMKALLDSEQKQLDEMSASGSAWVEAQMQKEIGRGGQFIPPEARADGNGPTTAEN
jgi:hypothetical protein